MSSPSFSASTAWRTVGVAESSAPAEELSSSWAACGLGIERHVTAIAGGTRARDKAHLGTTLTGTGGRPFCVHRRGKSLMNVPFSTSAGRARVTLSQLLNIRIAAR